MTEHTEQQEQAQQHQLLLQDAERVFIDAFHTGDPILRAHMAAAALIVDGLRVLCHIISRTEHLEFECGRGEGQP